MPVKHILRQAGGRCRMVVPFARARLADLGIAAVIVLSALGQATSAGGTPTMLYGTLDTEASTAAAESAAGVGTAMFEFDWAGFEPEQGTFNSSYLASMRAELDAYQAAGMDITLGLGLQDPPDWVRKLADATYVDQKGDVSAE
jgi:Beta-galactosidase